MLLVFIMFGASLIERLTMAALTGLMAGLTAWVGLMEHGHLQVGQKVLTQGSGGVSIAALQLAKAAGARVIATSGSNEKLKALGADEVINYRQVTDWDTEVKRLTNGRGVDVLLEVAGAETLNKSINSVKLDGSISLLGYVSGDKVPFSMLQAIMSGAKLQGSHVGSRTSFDNYLQALNYHRIKPAIDKVFAMEQVQQVQEAYAYLESGDQFGKIVIRL
jgi:NADPH:quinone reductase-like Zn-dependent oxidoreductase